MRLRELLIGHAAALETVTYASIRDTCEIQGDLVPILRELAEAEDDAGRGLLTAVVVRADTGRPGVGWYRLAAARGRDVDDRDVAWHGERALLAGVWGTATPRR